MFSIGEDWISYYEINENLYEHGILFWYCKIQGTNENRLIFWTYVRLVIADNVEPKFGMQSIGLTTIAQTFSNALGFLHS
jgi:hypothetical protein